VTSPIDRAKLSRPFTWGWRQSLVSKMKRKKERKKSREREEGQWIMSKKSIIVSMHCHHKLLDLINVIGFPFYRNKIQ
jgi:hypothetical protein